MPIVTIGLPFYNHADYLAEAIESIVNQRFQDWELLLVDDGSSDTSRQIAERWQTDPRIRLIADGHRLGRGARLNQIAALANGHFLARMDADDRMAPDRLDKQVHFLTTHPDVDLVGSFAYVMDKDGCVYGWRGTTRLPLTWQQAVVEVPIIHPSITGRTAWFRQHPYDTRWQRIDDLALWLNVIETATIRILPEPLLSYREHISVANYRLAMAEYRQLLVLYRQKLPIATFLKQYFVCYAKEAIFYLANRLHISEELRRRRSIPLNRLTPPKPLVVQVFTTARSLLFLKGQATFWHNKGFSMHILCADGPDRIRFQRTESHFNYTAIPFCRQPNLVQDLYCLWVTYWALRQLKPLIVHVNTPKAALLGMIAAWLARVPVRVYEIHGFPFETQTGLVRWLLIRTERFICTMATGIMAVSHSLKAVAIRHRLAPEATISVPGKGSCNGVDAELTFNRSRLNTTQLHQLTTQLQLTGSVIGYIGRLTHDKGLHQLVAGWQLIKTHYPATTLLIVGELEGASLAEQQLIRQLKADKHVRLIGHVTDVAYYLALMNVLILPTYREGFSNVLLEAAAMEVPVVANRVTGVDAVLEGKTGLLSLPRSAESMATAVLFYLTNPYVGQLHGQRARQEVLQHFRQAMIWEAKWHFYQQQFTDKALS